MNRANEISDIKKQVALSFGKHLNLLRKQKGISMDELALAVGSTKSAISRYENGMVAPTLDTAKKFADYFMVTVDWIGGFEDESEIASRIPQKYLETLKYAIINGITAEQLKLAVDFALAMKG